MKKVNFWPLHGGLAAISDATGQFLCHPDHVAEVLSATEGMDCGSVCSNGIIANWYVFIPGQQGWSEQGALYPNL